MLRPRREVQRGRGGELTTTARSSPSRRARSCCMRSISTTSTRTTTGPTRRRKPATKPTDVRRRRPPARTPLPASFPSRSRGQDTAAFRAAARTPTTDDALLACAKGSVGDVLAALRKTQSFTDYLCCKNSLKLPNPNLSVQPPGAGACTCFYHRGLRCHARAREGLVRGEGRRLVLQRAAVVLVVRAPRSDDRPRRAVRRRAGVHGLGLRRSLGDHRPVDEHAGLPLNDLERPFGCGERFARAGRPA